MFCVPCRAHWPGHASCPQCGADLVELSVVARQARIDRLPQFEDLAQHFEAGRAERARPPGPSPKGDGSPPR